MLSEPHPIVCFGVVSSSHSDSVSALGATAFGSSPGHAVEHSDKADHPSSSFIFGRTPYGQQQGGMYGQQGGMYGQQGGMNGQQGGMYGQQQGGMYGARAGQQSGGMFGSRTGTQQPGMAGPPGAMGSPVNPNPNAPIIFLVPTNGGAEAPKMVQLASLYSLDSSALMTLVATRQKRSDFF